MRRSRAGAIFPVLTAEVPAANAAQRSMIAGAALDFRGRVQIIAQEILRRLGLEDRNVPSELQDFIDYHVGPDRQLTLRLALT